MPMEAHNIQSSARRQRWGLVLLILPGVGVLLLGVIAWSFFQPIEVQWGDYGLGCRYQPGEKPGTGGSLVLRRGYGAGFYQIDLPGGTSSGSYAVYFYER